MGNNERNKVLMLLSLITQIGLTIVVNILICLYLGRFLDNHFNTKNICTVVMLFLGGISAIINTYSTLMRNVKNGQNKE